MVNISSHHKPQPQVLRVVYGLPEASSCFRSHGTGYSKGLNEIQGSYAVSYIAKNTATKVPSMIEVEA